MKKFLAVLLIGLVGLVVIAGCGKKEEKTAPATETAAPAPTDTTHAMDTTKAADTTKTK